MSASSNGDRRFGGVARMRRIPDSARRTTSARPGASSPAAVCTWLMLDTHRDTVAGVYRHLPTPVCSAAAAVTSCATTNGGPGNGQNPAASSSR